MINKDKIEQFLQTNPDFNEWYFISEVEENFFIYYIGFVDDADNLDGIYDCSVNVDDTIYYIRHIHNIIDEETIVEQETIVEEFTETSTIPPYTASNDTFI